ncbi:MAG: eukaryotic-like serine/threonine-protein kinase, partial [Thermoleophilaceae bacterium]|nr:eukaryotic-like serine/threonine-protein kinase [Thermoleophilaceae bacterium]
HAISIAQAFERLRSHARSSQAPIRSVAAAVVELGLRLDAPGPGAERERRIPRRRPTATTEHRRQLDSGLPAAPMTRGEHICALYSGADERDALIAPYLHAGLAAGDKCVSIVEAADQSSLVDAMANGLDLDAAAESQQLEFWTGAQSYLIRGGFSTDAMMGFWSARRRDALNGGGYRFLRSAGDASGVAALAEDFDEFAVYETEMNRLVAQQPQTVLCLYDLRIFGSNVVGEVLRTHPRVLLGGAAVDSPRYLTPDEYIQARGDRIQGWSALTTSERQLARHAAQGASASARDLESLYRKLEISSRDELTTVTTEHRDRP